MHFVQLTKIRVLDYLIGERPVLTIIPSKNCFILPAILFPTPLGTISTLLFQIEVFPDY